MKRLVRRVVLQTTPSQFHELTVISRRLQRGWKHNMTLIWGTRDIQSPSTVLCKENVERNPEKATYNSIKNALGTMQSLSQHPALGLRYLVPWTFSAVS